MIVCFLDLLKFILCFLAITKFMTVFFIDLEKYFVSFAKFQLNVIYSNRYQLFCKQFINYGSQQRSAVRYKFIVFSSRTRACNP